jgi:hypothetical protein
LSEGVALGPLQPVSAALEVQDELLRGVAARALAAVDRVHLVGALPRIPLDARRDFPRLEGQYRYKANTGRTLAIGIDPGGPVPELTVLHEVGHFLDLQALGKVGAFASSSRHPIMVEWERAVRATRTHRRLREMLRMNDLDLARATRSGDIAQQRASLRYLVRYTEFWARSYAQ